MKPTFWIKITFLIALTAAALVLGSPKVSRAGELINGGKLALTDGVASVDGSAGGGIATWAVIAGGETRDGVGASANATLVSLPDYELRDFGARLGLYDRLELSLAQQSFDTGATGAKLGLGSGFTFDQTIVGAKVRLLGDAVFDQDRLTPQISVGLQYKSNDRKAIIQAIGGKRADDIEAYLAATKILLDKSLIINGTVRMTRANQTGLLGFGGDRSDDYKPQFEGSFAWMANRRLVIGAEYRTKPDNLGFAREQDWMDVFVAFAPTRRVSVTLAYADLGDIATFRNQRGLYASLQAGF